MAGTLVLDTLQNGAGTASTSADNVINGCAKAWVNFNGTGTPAIRASYNVSSITDNGSGNFLINFIIAMPNADYSVQICSSAAVNNLGFNRTAASNTTTSCVVQHYENGSAVDTDVMTVAVFSN